MMDGISEEHMTALLEPFTGSAFDMRSLAPQLSAYLELLLRWNARTNLTSVRDPEEIIRRHFGESVFAAGLLMPRITAGSALLDLGSGAGFPGLPIQLCLPSLQVTLAESQGKKASFLREVVRTLGLRTDVWASRVETMPEERHFDVVTLRAVDQMEAAIEAAAKRVAKGGLLMVLGGSESSVPQGWSAVLTQLIPNSSARFVHVWLRPELQVV